MTALHAMKYPDIAEPFNNIYITDSQTQRNNTLIIMGQDDLLRVFFFFGMFAWAARWHGG